MAAAAPNTTPDEVERISPFLLHMEVGMHIYTILEPEQKGPMHEVPTYDDVVSLVMEVGMGGLLSRLKALYQLSSELTLTLTCPKMPTSFVSVLQRLSGILTRSLVVLVEQT